MSSSGWVVESSLPAERACSKWECWGPENSTAGPAGCPKLASALCLVPLHSAAPSTGSRRLVSLTLGSLPQAAYLQSSLGFFPMLSSTLCLSTTESCLWSMCQSVFYPTVNFAGVGLLPTSFLRSPTLHAMPGI